MHETDFIKVLEQHLSDVQVEGIKEKLEDEFDGWKTQHDDTELAAIIEDIPAIKEEWFYGEYELTKGGKVYIGSEEMDTDSETYANINIWWS
jgi:hypothetical protein